MRRSSTVVAFVCLLVGEDTTDVVFFAVVGGLVVVGGGVEGLVLGSVGVAFVVMGSSVGFAKMLHSHLLGTTITLRKNKMKGCLGLPY